MTTSTETAVASLSEGPGVSSVALASVTGAVAVCSLVGNMFVFLTISKSKTLHRINNALILSLAVADLVRSSMVVPLYSALLLIDVSPTDQHWLCPLYTAVLVFCEVAVILNVTFIAIERVFVITKPLLYQRTVTLPKVSVIIASLWIFSLVFGLLQALRFLPEADPDRSESAAFTSAVCFTVPSLGYAVFDVTLTLVVPVVTLFVCYGKIFFVVHSQMRRIVPVVSDTYGNSEAVFSYGGESWRQAYVTRSTSVSARDSSVTHGPPENRRQQNVFTIDVVPSSAHETEGPLTAAASSSSNFFSTVRPLSNIEEDRVESRGQSSDGGTQKRSEKPSPTTGDNDKPIRILVTQPSRESFNPNVGNDLQREMTLGHDLLLPGAVPSAGELEPILSPINLNRTLSVSRSEPGPSGTIPIRRGSSVTFDLKNGDDSAPDLPNDTSPHRTKRRGSHITTNQSSGSSSGDGSLNPAVNRTWSNPRRPSYESSTSRVSSVNPTLGGVPSGPPSRRNSVSRINDNKAFKMTIVVVGAFLVCWMPAKICYLLRVISGSLISNLTFDIVTCLTLVASALDPYVYNFYSSEFRRALKRVLTCSADKPDMPWM